FLIDLSGSGIPLTCTKVLTRKDAATGQAFVTSDSTATELTGSSPATTHRVHFRLTRYCRGSPRCFGMSDALIWPGSPAGRAGPGPRPGDDPGAAEGRGRPSGRQLP